MSDQNPSGFHISGGGTRKIRQVTHFVKRLRALFACPHAAPVDATNGLVVADYTGARSSGRVGTRTGRRPPVRLTWLASYPKCGNTWARFLIYQYAHGEAASSQQIAREIPDLHVEGQVQAVSAGRQSMTIKTHAVWTPQTRGERYVYIVRHPRDVLLSCLHYMRVQSPGALNKGTSDEQYARLFLKLRGDPLYLQSRFGTVEEHWRSWLEQTRMPGIVVRYEDMKADAARELRRIVESMGEAFDEARGRRAVELSSFDRMRALEVREKSAGAAGGVFFGTKQRLREGLLFMNKGQSNRSLEPIAAGLDAECDAVFRATLDRFGYPAGRA